MAEQRNHSRFKKFSVALVAGIVVVSGGVMSSQAASAKKGKVATPQAPTIVSVETKPLKKGFEKADVIVTVALPTNVPTKSISLTEVFVGNKKCVIKKAKTSCKFRNFDANYMNQSISARTKVGSKFSKSSKKIKFNITPMKRKWYNPAFRITPTVNRNLAAVLGTASGKATNMQGVRRGVRTSSASTPRVGALSASNVRFSLNVAGAVAYAQIEDSNSSGSGLSAISATGVVSEALIENPNWVGSTPPGAPGPTPNMMRPKVSKFYVAPSGKIYVLFNMKFEMVSGSDWCLFYSFDVDSGLPNCVDPSLSGMVWNGGWMSQRYTNPGVQFDDAGNVYYMGYGSSMGPGTPVLRKLAVGSTVPVDLGNSNLRIDDFAVLPDGSVIVVGGTSSTSAAWTRVISPTNSLRNLGAPFTSSAAKFVTRFADGNYYLGSWSQSNRGSDSGVIRYVPSTGQLEAKYWIRTNTWKDNGQTVNESVNGSEFNGICTGANGNTNYSDPFCQWGGSLISKVATVGGRNFVLSQSMDMSSSKTSLLQYYPTLQRVPVSIANVTLIESTGTKLIVTGTDSNGLNIMSVYDPATGAETVVMDGTNEVEIYSMTYVPAVGKVMFSGLQFSNNSYVVGEIAIP
jgi:hypothetical protein